MPVILGGLVLLAYAFHREREAARLAILYFAAVYCGTTLLWQTGYSPTTNQEYFAVLGTASFILLAMYHSIDMTPSLLAASICELIIITICLLGAVGWAPAVAYFTDVAGALNWLALAILSWGWMDGDIDGGRRIYRGLVNPSWFGISAADRALARLAEKVRA
jgi:hypothetical protein